jgi:hypothetical protein
LASGVFGKSPNKQDTSFYLAKIMDRGENEEDADEKRDVVVASNLGISGAENKKGASAALINRHNLRDRQTRAFISDGRGTCDMLGRAIARYKALNVEEGWGRYRLNYHVFPLKAINFEHVEGGAVAAVRLLETASNYEHYLMTENKQIDSMSPSGFTSESGRQAGELSGASDG